MKQASFKECNDIYQKVFSLINDAIYNKTRGIKDSTRNTLIFLCCAYLEYIFFFYIDLFSKTKFVMLYGTILILLISLLCIRRQTVGVVFNSNLYLPLAIFATGIIAISLFHKVGNGYVLFAIDILQIFPFFYFVLINSESTKTLFRMIALSSIIEGIISFVLCIVLSFQGRLGLHGNRVQGHTINPNLLGAIGLVVFIIDYAYRCGFIVAFFYCIFYVLVGMKGLKLLFSSKHSCSEDFLIVAIIGSYSLYAMIEIANLPFTRCVPCLFYILIAPIICRKAYQETDEQSASRCREAKY